MRIEALFGSEAIKASKYAIERASGLLVLLRFSKNELLGYRTYNANVISAASNVRAGTLKNDGRLFVAFNDKLIPALPDAGRIVGTCSHQQPLPCGY